MNEQELRDSLREVMVASSPPPSMNPNAALDSARRAHKRRRATYAGTAAGVAVVALAAGTMFALSPGETPLPIDPAAPPAAGGAPNIGGTIPNPAGESTKTEWPDGQNDRTATTGPQAAKGETLLASLKTQLPDTLIANTTITYPGTDPNDKRPITGSQSQFVDYAGGDKTKPIWEYAATVAVNSKAAPNSGTGRILVQSITPGRDRVTDVCEIAKGYWGVGGTCQTRQVQGKTVGLITKTQDQRIDQVVAYGYTDGTEVVVAQSKQPDNTGDSTKPADGSMAQVPLTEDQLMALVLSPAFKVS